MRFEQEPNEGHPDCHAILWSFPANLRINRTNRTVCKKSAYISYQQKLKKKTYTENPWNPYEIHCLSFRIYVLFCWLDVLFRGFESGPVLAREPLHHSPSNSPFWDPPNDDGDTRHRSGHEQQKRWQVPKTGGKDAAFSTRGGYCGGSGFGRWCFAKGCRALISPCWECSRRVRLSKFHPKPSFVDQLQLEKKHHTTWMIRRLFEKFVSQCLFRTLANQILGTQCSQWFLHFVKIFSGGTLSFSGKGVGGLVDYTGAQIKIPHMEIFQLSHCEFIKHRRVESTDMDSPYFWIIV